MTVDEVIREIGNLHLQIVEKDREIANVKLVNSSLRTQIEDLQKTVDELSEARKELER